MDLSPQISTPEQTQDSTEDPLQSNASSKRKRDSIPPSESLERAAKHSKTSHRHAKHWELDGDLFMRISDCWMRLRKASLLRHSEWFSDVFTAIEEGRIKPDPKRPYEEGSMILVDVKDVQKCCHVPAVGVSVSDLGLLLTAIDNAIPPPFPIISAILRASTELKFPMFRDWAMQSIQKMWCSSLASLTTEVIPHATETAILGRAWDVSGVLKRALYELLRTSESTPYERRLLPADIICLVNAREELDLIWLAATSFDVFSTSHDSDSNDAAVDSSMPRCPPMKYATYKNLVHDTSLFQNYRFDVICGLQMLIQIDWESETADSEGRGWCSSCASKIREHWQMEREKTWEKLDRLFRLELSSA
ncbi:hypothetical protein C8J57DRAFT_1502007 [Mycena rebaudengoi]|nr:hypothetical protein C8J57DRAFT_1502007 [Mycena rebaudengoi]